MHRLATTVRLGWSTSVDTVQRSCHQTRAVSGTLMTRGPCPPAARDKACVCLTMTYLLSAREDRRISYPQTEQIRLASRGDTGSAVVAHAHFDRCPMRTPDINPTLYQRPHPFSCRALKSDVPSKQSAALLLTCVYNKGAPTIKDIFLFLWHSRSGLVGRTRRYALRRLF